MIQNLVDLDVQYSNPIPIHYDNTSATSVPKNHVLHSKTKHIPIKYHFMREKVTNRMVKLNFIPSTKQTIDIFNKPLSKTQFEYLQQNLGVIPSSN